MSLVATPYSVAMRDPNIVGTDYEAPSWDAWWVMHAAIDAQPPPVDRVPHWLEIWDAIAGGRAWPTVRPREVWTYGSRRIAKTREWARRRAWNCVTFDPSKLSRGERAACIFTAPDRAQSTLAFEFAAAFVEGSPMLAKMIESRTAQELRFINRTTMGVGTASFRTGARGRTILGFHFDEAAYQWDTEVSANPFTAQLAAARPGMSTIAEAQLSVATTPHGRTTEVWRTFNRFWGENNARVLVLKVPWYIGNPTLDPEMIANALEEDEPTARAEYFAEFRTDVETYVSRENVQACVVPDREDLPAMHSTHYVGFLDAASGSGAESFGYAVAHQNAGGASVVDLAREIRPPFSPADTIHQAAADFARFRVHTVVADRWGGEWVAELARTFGLHVRHSDLTKSQIYEEFLPLVNTKAVELPDNARLIGQLCALERRVARGGRPSIDHPARGGKDDLVNAVAGAVVAANRARRTQIDWLRTAV